MKKKSAFTRLVKPFARIWTRAKAYWLGCTRNPTTRVSPLVKTHAEPSSTIGLSHPSFASAHSYGFTLAEVLITLTILGVVAAIAIPSLVRRYQDKQTVTQVKRAYSIIDNAIMDMIAVEGDPNNWKWPNRNELEIPSTQENINFFYEKLLPYISNYKVCGNAYGCFNPKKTEYYKTLNGGTYSGGQGETEYNVQGKTILKSGMLFSFTGMLYRRDMGGFFVISRIDINGSKPPNRFGYDVFFFVINKNGVMSKYTPRYVSIGDYYQAYYDSSCCKFGADSSSSMDGVSCSFWVLKHGNLDYKYRDVSKEW